MTAFGYGDYEVFEYCCERMSDGFKSHMADDTITVA